MGRVPLYALRECFHGPHGIDVTEANIFGVLSLIVWSLILVVSVKYLTFVLRADNKGEGGILALMALALSDQKNQSKKLAGTITVLGLFGAALLYGDGIITPAISVLGAIEGLKIATPLFDPYIIPITVTILSVLFFFQKRGTADMGKAFGPIILIWFVVLGALGIKGMLSNFHILEALNPAFGINFLLTNSWHGLVVLGSVFLVVTGGEALYADLGHFGRRPIQLGWFCVALPGLVLQYFGQGALLLQNPAAAENPFYLLAPTWALYPLVLLSTSAAVIASQALITGAFSMSQQAMQLGFLPRMAVKYTSAKEMGQIYVPFINWALLIGTLFLVFEFQTSGKLAAAYGIAVTATMVITTMLTYIVMRHQWKWSIPVALPLCLFFIVIDLAFFTANAVKILDGGWFPIAAGLIILTLMLTWKKGRSILASRLLANSTPLTVFMNETVPNTRARLPGAAVFMTAISQGTPSALLHNVRHNQVIHELVLLLTIQNIDSPYVAPENHIRLEDLGNGFHRVIVFYGFMESPNVPDILTRCFKLGLPVELSRTTFFLGRETIIATDTPGMAVWREELFAFMSRNASRAADFFKIPSNQTIEIGVVVEM
ncbi:MAG TPA: potassium transporter Kup [Oligoflexus sp.]|nr:potassium transporter Kup [Oligoflexus sp.]HYX36894.1 potassium transporter Kup [Oligoflexus sp.]